MSDCMKFNYFMLEPPDQGENSSAITMPKNSEALGASDGQQVELIKTRGHYFVLILPEMSNNDDTV